MTAFIFRSIICLERKRGRSFGEGRCWGRSSCLLVESSNVPVSTPGSTGVLQVVSRALPMCVRASTCHHGHKEPAGFDEDVRGAATQALWCRPPWLWLPVCLCHRAFISQHKHLFEIQPVTGRISQGIKPSSCLQTAGSSGASPHRPSPLSSLALTITTVNLSVARINATWHSL